MGNLEVRASLVATLARLGLEPPAEGGPRRGYSRDPSGARGPTGANDNQEKVLKDLARRIAASDLLDKDEDQVVEAIHESLAEIASKSVPALIALFRTDRWQVRISAATSLAQFGSAARAALPVLEEALKDPDDRICQVAAAARAHILSRSIGF